MRNKRRGGKEIPRWVAELFSKKGCGREREREPLALVTVRWLFGGGAGKELHEPRPDPALLAVLRERGT